MNVGIIGQGFDNLNIILSPEFLTEDNSIEDFKNQTRIILGGPRPHTTKVKSMFRKRFPQIPIVKTGYKTADIVKYFINNFLSTEVIFANKMYRIYNLLDINYDKVTEYALFNERVGRSHLSVPGSDGDFGYGGHCFPKDIDTMIYLTRSMCGAALLLEQIKRSNECVRKDRNWESMKDQAASDED